MTNFLAAAHLDTFDLAASLRTRFGLFTVEAGGALACPVRQRRGEKWVRPSHAATGKWPELTNALQKISRLGEAMGGIEFGRIDLLLLPGGGCMNWRTAMHEYAALGKYAEEHEHAIMLLRTSPACSFFSGSEVATPGIGFLTIVSRRLPRSAINLGEAAAIWLALDFRKRDAGAEPVKS